MTTLKSQYSTDGKDLILKGQGTSAIIKDYTSSIKYISNVMIGSSSHDINEFIPPTTIYMSSARSNISALVSEVASWQSSSSGGDIADTILEA